MDSKDQHSETGPENGQSDQEYIAFIDSDTDPDSDLEIDLSPKPKSTASEKPFAKVPKHFRKNNAQVYDNISVYAPPDSNLIFRCSQKRANWYLSRNLARSLSPTSIHLNFAPAGQGHANDSYYLEERENKCVVCGQATAEAGATMLHVVPEQYRKWFPIRLKSHSSHDVVVACPECNAQWDREAAVVRKTIVGLYKIPLEGVGWIKDHEAGLAKRSAGAVIADWNRQWQEHHAKHQQEQTRDTESSLTSVGVMAGNMSMETAATKEQGSKNKKKITSKKQNIIPPARVQELERNVFSWWNKVHKKPEEGSSQDTSSLQKRDLASDDDRECRKRLKTADAAVSVPQPVAERRFTEDEASSRRHKEEDRIEVPSPPPGHDTVLNRSMLEAALAAQAMYKGPNYKEHGQLVITQVMASSPEYHQDEHETLETIRSWKEAQPLSPAPIGWQDVSSFIRSWRQAFLERIKPRHLSTEWRVENPV
ncbi:hypothetical protein EDD11_000554 [Mortierella claussenii]|nr:hypothetical protein EDD11_000554 [Mortierella claussenii]